jgi:hypothetical protein
VRAWRRWYLGYYTVTHLRLQSEFEKMLPKNHPYVMNYKENADQLRGLRQRAADRRSRPSEPTIYTPHYLQTLQDASESGVLHSRRRAPEDEVAVDAEHALQGGDRGGFRGRFSHTSRLRRISGVDRDAVELNVARAGLRGNLVANDERSAGAADPADGPQPRHRRAPRLRAP